MSELALVHPKDVDEFAPRIRTTIESIASQSSGRYTAQNIFDFARKGVWQIWVIYEGAEIVFVGATEVIVFPSGLDGFVIHFGEGSGRERWQHHIDAVLAWGKAQADGRKVLCNGAFRIGWRRVLPGWMHSHDILERWL